MVRFPLAAVLAIAASSAGIRANDWGTYRGDAAHTGRSAAGFDPRQLSFKWQSPNGYANPVIAGDLVYADTWQQSGPAIGRVTAFDRRTGAVAWSSGGQFRRVSPVTVAYGLAVYQAEDPTAADPKDAQAIWVHDAATGALKYRVPLAFVNPSNPVTLARQADNTIEAYLSYSGMWAWTLGPVGPRAKWATGDAFSLYSPATVAGQTVVGGNFGNARAYDRTTGTPATFYNFGSTGGSTAGVSFDAANNRVFVNAGGAGLYAYRYNGPTDITPLWDSGTSKYGDQPATIAEDGNLYLVDGGTQQLVEVDGATGRVLRGTTLGGFAGYDTPVLQGNYVWVSGSRSYYDQELRVLDRATLSVVRTFPAGDPPDYTYYAPPVVSGDTMALPFHSGVSEFGGFQVYAVPEPGTAALVGGALLLGTRRRLRTGAGPDGA